jgi:hypothetical protein
MTKNDCKSENEKRRIHEIISDNHSMSELFVFPHNPEVGGSSPLPATTKSLEIIEISRLLPVLRNILGVNSMLGNWAVSYLMFI